MRLLALVLSASLAHAQAPVPVLFGNTSPGEVILLGAPSPATTLCTNTGIFTPAVAGIFGTASSFTGTSSDNPCVAVSPSTSLATQWWASGSASSGYLGYALSAPTILTRWRMASRPIDGGSSSFWLRSVGITLRGASTAAGCPTETVLDQIGPIGTYPYTLEQQTTGTNERLIASSTAYQYYCIVSAANGYGNISQFQIIGKAGNGAAAAQPVEPHPAPWGGYVQGLSQVVSITTATSGARILYTTSGTAPSCPSTGTVYTSPITLGGSSGASTTLKIIACDSALSTPASPVSTAVYYWGGWTNQLSLVDKLSGNPLPHDLKFNTVGSTLYGTGVFLGNDASNTSAQDGIWQTYSTDNGVSWAPSYQLLDNTSAAYTYVLRPSLLDTTVAGANRWVMWANNSSLSSGPGGLAVVSGAPAVNGPFAVINDNLNVDGLGSYKDHAEWVDPLTGNAWSVYNSQGSSPGPGMVLSQLTSNMQNTTGSPVRLMSGTNEGFIIFRQGSIVYIINGLANYYNDNNSYEPSVMMCEGGTLPACTDGTGGGWTANTAISGYGGIGSTTQGQPSGVYYISSLNQWVYVADSWGENDARGLYGSQWVFQPIIFTSGVISLGGQTTWLLP